MKIKIHSRQDYELYVRKTLKIYEHSDKVEQALFNAIMAAFDDGIKLAMSKLEVEVRDG